MAAIKLFIATSIDGFIARENGSLDWLHAIAGEPDLNAPVSTPEKSAPDGGYGEFMAGIDVVIMGRSTYDEIVGFDVEWPYAALQSLVLTSDQNFVPSTPNTQIVHSLDDELVDHLRSISQKGVWVIGGGKVITQFLNLNAIDEMTLTIISTILGAGIPLFPNHPNEIRMDLVEVKKFSSGMVNLVYSKRATAD